MTSQLQSNFSSQETLGTLAVDTGGKLFVDSNDFGPAFQSVQHDTEAYYIIGYQSTNPARDGTYRHLTINLLNHPDASSSTGRDTMHRRTSSTPRPMTVNLP